MLEPRARTRDKHHVAIIEAYDGRAATYDLSTWHAQLAVDVATIYANIKPGETVLDLCCGTGLVTFSAIDAGATKVIGVDISPASISVAREKAAARQILGTKVELFEHDVTDLQSLETLSDYRGRFDAITCCSAFVLLSNNVETLSEILKTWASFLKPSTGRIVFDVPPSETQVLGTVLEEVAEELGIADQLLWSRRWITGPERVAEVMTQAGLTVQEIRDDGKVYQEQHHDLRKVTEIWDQLVEGPLTKPFALLRNSDSESFERAKSSFIEKLKARGAAAGCCSTKGGGGGGGGGGEEVLDDPMHFYIAIARREEEGEEEGEGGEHSER